MTDVTTLEWETMGPAPEVDPVLVELERLRKLDPMPYRRMVDDFRDGTVEAREVADKSRRYFENDQIFGDIEKAWKRSRQPKVIRNEITPAIEGLLGVIRQAKVDPKAWPRNPQNEDQADVASKALRFVADVNKWHSKKVDAAETFYVEGIAAVAVEADEDGTPKITQLPYDELIYDPYSRQANFSDAAYLGIGKWMYQGDLQARYPMMREDLDAAFTSTSWGADMGLDRPDKPENAIGTNWLDPRKRRIFVVELYHREDAEWMRCVFYVGGVLEHSPSPYKGDRGESLCAFVFHSCLVTRDNQRTGRVKFMLSGQDELNAYGSRALHLSRSRQLKVSDPAFPPEVDARTAAVEAAKPDGVIPTGYELIPTSDLLAGMQLMMSEARQSIVRQAPTPAVLADASASNQSGRSRLVLQQAGMTEIARSMGRIEDWENEVYAHEWAILKQFKRDEWWIRTTGDDAKKPEFTGINVWVGPDGQPIPAQMAEQMKAQGIPVEMKNNLAEMDVDIEVENVPDTANLQAEQFEALSPMFTLLASDPNVGPKKTFEIAVALSSIPEKGRVKELIDKEDEIPPEQQAQQQQMAQMQQQVQQVMTELQVMKERAAIEKTQSETALNQAKIEQIDAEVTIEAIDTRMKLQGGQEPPSEPMSPGFPPRSV
jgi:hypothetical protein